MGYSSLIRAKIDAEARGIPAFDIRPGLDENGFDLIGNDHTGQAAGEGLFVDMRMQQFAGAKDLPILQHDPPSVGVVVPAGVAVAQRDRQAALRVGGVDHLGRDSRAFTSSTTAGSAAALPAIRPKRAMVSA